MFAPTELILALHRRWDSDTAVVLADWYEGAGFPGIALQLREAVADAPKWRSFPFPFPFNREQKVLLGGVPEASGFGSYMQDQSLRRTWDLVTSLVRSVSIDNTCPTCYPSDDWAGL